MEQVPRCSGENETDALSRSHSRLFRPRSRSLDHDLDDPDHALFTVMRCLVWACGTSTKIRGAPVRTTVVRSNR